MNVKAKLDYYILRIDSKIRWGLSKKITVLILILLTALIIDTVIAASTLQWINKVFKYNFNMSMERTLIAGNMNENIMQFDRLIVEHIRSRYLADRNTIEKELSSIEVKMLSDIGSYKKVYSSSRDEEFINQFEKSWDDYYSTTGRIIEKSNAGDAERALELWDGWASVRYRDLRYFVDKIIDYNSQLVKETGIKANANNQKAIFDIVLISSSMSIFAILFGAFIIRYIQISIRKLIESNEKIGMGDFNAHAGMQYYGEMGELAKSSDKMIVSLQRMATDVKELMGKLSTVSYEYIGYLDNRKEEEISEKIIEFNEAAQLIQILVKSLNGMKSAIEELCTSTDDKNELEKAHAVTIDTLSKINTEVGRMEVLLKEFEISSDKFNVFAQSIIINGFDTADKPVYEYFNTVKNFQEIVEKIINTIEIIKYGLLDQKMMLESKNSNSGDSRVYAYFHNVSGAIYEILKKTEDINTVAKKILKSVLDLLGIIEEILDREGDSQDVAVQSGEYTDNELALLIGELNNAISKWKI